MLSWQAELPRRHPSQHLSHYPFPLALVAFLLISIALVPTGL